MVFLLRQQITRGWKLALMLGGEAEHLADQVVGGVDTMNLKQDIKVLPARTKGVNLAKMEY